MKAVKIFAIPPEVFLGAQWTNCPVRYMQIQNVVTKDCQSEPMGDRLIIIYAWSGTIETILHMNIFTL
jgi:hypothetical protein